MQFYIIAIVLALSSLKGIFETFKLSEENKKIVKIVLIIALLYYVYKFAMEQTNKRKALDDESGQHAVELHNAIYSGAFSVLGIHVGNGDEEAILEVSTKITNMDEVSRWYKSLYNLDLFAELEKILSTEEFATFNRNIQANKPIETGGQTSSTGTSTNQGENSTVNTGFVKGDKIYSNVTGLNVRYDKNTDEVLFKANIGEYLGDFIAYTSFSLDGKTYKAVLIDVPFYKSLTSPFAEGVCVASYVKTK